MWLILPLLTLGFFLFSCDRNEPFEEPHSIGKEGPKGKKVGNLVINENTVILNASSLGKIKTVSDDKVIFDSEPIQSDSICEGALLIGAIYDGTSVKNIMGKVENVNVKGGEWHVGLTPIEIEEFIYSGTITGRVFPSSYDENPMSRSSSGFAIFQDVEGFPSYAQINEEIQKTRAEIALPRLEHSNTYKIPIPGIPAIDLHSAFSMSAGFTPVFDYAIRFDLTGIKEFTITVYARDIWMDARLQAYAGVDFNLSMADMYSIPIVPIVLGPTGLIISPTISGGPYINLQAGGQFDAQLFHAEGEISYVLTNPTQSPKWNLNVDPYGWNNIELTAHTRAEAGLHFNAGFSLMFITTNIASVGGSSKIGVGAKFEAESLNQMSLNVYGRVNANARLVLGVWPFKYEKTYPIISWNPTIYACQSATDQ